MAHLVGEKGQVVIEKPLRQALGIQPGFATVQTLVNDHVEIRFYPPEHDRSLRGILEQYVQRTVPAEEWNEVREQAWEEGLKDRIGTGGDR